jgi:hypothetical protein
MSVFATITPRLTLTSPQVALILGVERICQAAGLWLVCPVCAEQRGTYKHLLTRNGTQDHWWKVDCPCTERRFQRSHLQHTMTPDGALLLLAETLLPSARLAVRCPTKATGCLTTPLAVTQEVDGVTARCQCWQADLTAGVYRFRNHPATVPA